MITVGLVATVEKDTATTEAELLFRGRFQQVLGVRFIAAASTEGQKSASPDKLCQEERLGGHQNLLRTLLAQHLE